MGISGLLRLVFALGRMSVWKHLHSKKSEPAASGVLMNLLFTVGSKLKLCLDVQKPGLPQAESLKTFFFFVQGDCM